MNQLLLVHVIAFHCVTCIDLSNPTSLAIPPASMIYLLPPQYYQKDDEIIFLREQIEQKILDRNHSIALASVGIFWWGSRSTGEALVRRSPRGGSAGRSPPETGKVFKIL